jgi:hypothetical protein
LIYPPQYFLCKSNKNLEHSKFMTAYKLVTHPFENSKLRCFWDNDAWRYSIVDLVDILTDTQNAQQYWWKIKTHISISDMNKEPLKEWQNFSQIATKIDGITLLHTDANGLFMLLENIPCDKTESVRAWLGEVFETWVD